MNLRITGLDKYLRDLAAADGGIERAMADAGAASIDVLTPVFEQETPVDTGFLLDSETLFQPTTGAVTFEAAADYASFVNDGTRFQPANPFVDRAVDRARGDVGGVYERAIDAFTDDFGE
jgi:hypothetical protein